MKTLKINNLKIKVKGQKVEITDIFNDVSDQEIYTIAKYLFDEGFLKDRSRVEVTLINK